MGENPNYVFVVGAPGIDQILSEELTPAPVIMQKYHLNPDKPFFLVVQHPVTLEADDAATQMKATLGALSKLNIQTLIIYPNADAGGRKMIRIIEHFTKNSMFTAFKSIPHNDYLSLLRCSAALIGNSSSGIIEAPTLGVPVVNIGSRQQGRQRGDNVIDTSYDEREIIAAIKKSLSDRQFLEQVKNCKSPYGDGTCSQKIVDVLSTISLNKSLIQKQMMY
jgi:UDP-hydrolysing UDP-N-acetyl-D-glucosamine 2-epimerase